MIKYAEISSNISKGSSSSKVDAFERSSLKVSYGKTATIYEGSSKETSLRKLYEESVYQKLNPTYKNFDASYEEVVTTYEESIVETS